MRRSGSYEPPCKLRTLFWVLHTLHLIVTTVFSGRITYVKWGETTNIKKWNIGTRVSFGATHIAHGFTGDRLGLQLSKNTKNLSWNLPRLLCDPWEKFSGICQNVCSENSSLPKLITTDRIKTNKNSWWVTCSVQCLREKNVKKL